VGPSAVDWWLMILGRFSPGFMLLFAASVFGAGCSGSASSNSPAKGYWDGQSQEVKDFACKVGAETAAGLEWEPTMNFTLSELEEVIAEAC
jgi:hypothetical protein